MNGQLKNKYGDAFIRGNNGKDERLSTSLLLSMVPALADADRVPLSTFLILSKAAGPYTWHCCLQCSTSAASRAEEGYFAV